MFQSLEPDGATHIEGTLLDAMLGLADIDQHPCSSIERVTLGNPSLQTTFLLLERRQDRGQ
ncbi:MAG: hypothetical protein ACLP4V_06765 [Methylocella sp.]